MLNRSKLKRLRKFQLRVCNGRLTTSSLRRRFYEIDVMDQLDLKFCAECTLYDFIILWLYVLPAPKLATKLARTKSLSHRVSETNRTTMNETARSQLIKAFFFTFEIHTSAILTERVHTTVPMEIVFT